MTTGAKLAKKILNELKRLNFSNNAKEELTRIASWDRYFSDEFDMYKIRYYNFYDLIPEYLEELFTLRGERHQVFVISGIEKTEHDKYISFVSVAFPAMGWEIIEEFKKDFKTKSSEELYYDWYYTDLDELRLDIECRADLDFSERFYYPVLAEIIKDPFKSRTEYLRRREIMILIIALLHERFGFNIYFSQSGYYTRGDTR